MQSVPITTDAVSLNLDQGEVYNIMWYSLSVTCDMSVVFSGSSGFLHKKNDCHDITKKMVESGIKHHQTNKQKLFFDNKKEILNVKGALH